MKGARHALSVFAILLAGSCSTEKPSATAARGPAVASAQGIELNRLSEVQGSPIPVFCWSDVGPARRECGYVEAAAYTGTVSAAILTSDEAIAPLLPWPPPLPSTEADLTKQVGASGKYGQIARRIESHLTPRGYDNIYYYRLKGGGFAMATELERYGSDGKPAPAGRFKQGKLGILEDLMSYARSFLKGEDGRFRQFIFLVTDQGVTYGSSATEGDVLRWKETASYSLPSSLAGTKASAGTKVRLFVYEFVASKGREGRLSSATERVERPAHLQALGFHS